MLKGGRAGDEGHQQRQVAFYQFSPTVDVMATGISTTAQPAPIWGRQWPQQGCATVAPPSRSQGGKIHQAHPQEEGRGVVASGRKSADGSACWRRTSCNTRRTSVDRRATRCLGYGKDEVFDAQERAAMSAPTPNGTREEMDQCVHDVIDVPDAPLIEPSLRQSATACPSPSRLTLGDSSQRFCHARPRDQG